MARSVLPIGRGLGQHALVELHLGQVPEQPARPRNLPPPCRCGGGLDGVRFPDEPESRLASAVFSARRPGETKRQGVARNLKLLGERTRRLGVPFTIDVFGLTRTWNPDAASLTPRLPAPHDSNRSAASERTI